MTEVDVDAAPLAEVVRAAWRIGKTVDLAGIGYGRIHWGNQQEVVDTPFPYYFFLAGFARLIGARRVIEIGTHQGGSTRAILAGMPETEGVRILTFDLSADGTTIFEGHPVVKAFQLNGNSEAALEATADMRVEGAYPDLVYIDAVHAYEQTMKSFRRYGEQYHPRFVILDDITLNEGMQQFWNEITAEYGDEAIDASTVERVRLSGPGQPGFGVVRTRRRE